jgi:hypothetical protein
MWAPVGSMSSVPLENGDKARKEFENEWIIYSNPVSNFLTPSDSIVALKQQVHVSYNCHNAARRPVAK